MIVMMKWSAVLLFFLLHPLVIHAKSMTFTIPSHVLQGDQELTITASASGFTTQENLYIKGAFFKEGSSNYFGYTKYGDTWIKNSTSTVNQRKVYIGEWDGTVTVKADYNDSGFVGNGSYKLKLGFYTLASDGDISNVHWSETIASLELEQPPPTPTTVPTNTPVPTQSPSSTPTPVTTIVQTQTPLPSRTQPTPPLSKVSFVAKTQEKKVLGDTFEYYSTPSSILSNEATSSVQGQSRTTMIIPFGLMGVGTGILSFISVLQIINKKDQAA